MGSRILIVEDLFIEANDLRIILERAGHTISGIAKSVDMALTYLNAGSTDIVLLDIFLTGKLTGIELGKVLTHKNIPFIYLSANSNTSVLNSAKETQPYGFLVKPFRERDILVALDVAMYRHHHINDQHSKQEKWLMDMLNEIMEAGGTSGQKLLRLVRTLKIFLSFDYIIIDADLSGDDLAQFYQFKRMGYDEYTEIKGQDYAESAGLTMDALMACRKRSSSLLVPSFVNGNEFIAASSKNIIMNAMRSQHLISSGLWMPLLINGEADMSFSFFSKHPESFNQEHLDLLVSVAGVLASILGDIRSTGITSPKDSSDVESIDQPSLGADIVGADAFEGIVGKSTKLLQVLDQVTQVATYGTSVLILGETGVGKEGLAKAIHEMSNRRLKPFVKVNCASIPASLIESELFGYEKGAFTGANERRIGKFEQASGSTIFLDEIGEIPLELQSKLLRVLQEKQVERIGGRTTIDIDVRIIAATNKNLHKEVAEGKFRIDLYYRLNVFPITLPPLRERKEDIPSLANHFLGLFASLSSAGIKNISAGAMEQLMNYSWPGNIRELEHLIERHILITPSSCISWIDLPENDDLSTVIHQQPEPAFRSMAEADKDHIIEALKQTNGKISGPGGAAEMLNIPVTTLNARMKKLGIAWKFLFE